MSFVTDEKLAELAGRATHFSTHSGEVGPGGIFIALRGGSRDGHDFVPALLEKGILAAIVDRDLGLPNAFAVKNSNAAHWKIASEFRAKFTGAVIGVGGSNGKTSTKELLHQVLSQELKCVKTEKSQNGLLGIPKTLEKLRADVDVAIVEIGIDAPGEMARNVALVRPTHALLTSIGEEHLELLKDLEGVFKEERVLIDDCVARGGRTYVPAGDSFLRRLTAARQVSATPGAVDPRLQVDQKDRHILHNMAMVATIALDLGLTVEAIGKAFAQYETPDGRGLKWKVGATWVIRDHYNANPSSMSVALKSAAQFARDQGLELRLMLGDMRELGTGSGDYHHSVVAQARAVGAKKILWVGPEFSAAIAGPLEHEVNLISSGDNLPPELVEEFKRPGVVLVKGSRGTAMERVMDRIFGIFKASGI